MKDRPLKALTIDALWAWAIAHAGKRVENRGWRTHYRGPLAIHAGLTVVREADDLKVVEGILRPNEVDLLKIRPLAGHVLAVCELVECVKLQEPPLPLLGEPAVAPDTAVAPDPWAFGPWCWRLDKVQVLAKPVAVRGKQGLWNLPEDIEQAVRRQL